MARRKALCNVIYSAKRARIARRAIGDNLSTRVRSTRCRPNQHRITVIQSLPVARRLI